MCGFTAQLKCKVMQRNKIKISSKKIRMASTINKKVN